jgi:hypothetical protein
MRSDRLLRGIGIAAVFALQLASQETPEPLDPSSAKTSYSFPLRAREERLRFEVQIDKSSTIRGVKVFRSGDTEPFQLLASCNPDALLMELNEYDAKQELLKHQDLNFDGYEDVELLQYLIPHLGKSLYCIYVWNATKARFILDTEIPETDPVADPQSKTISAHEEFFGGVFIDSVYKWSGGKLVQTLKSGRLSGSDKPTCGFTDFCSELVNGKLRDTASNPSGCGDAPDRPLVCPVPAKKNSR